MCLPSLINTEIIIKNYDYTTNIQLFIKYIYKLIININTILNIFYNPLILLILIKIV